MVTFQTQKPKFGLKNLNFGYFFTQKLVNFDHLNQFLKVEIQFFDQFLNPKTGKW